MTGYDADLTIVDLKREETITNKWIASRAAWTPYDGVKVKGWPVGTLVRGKRVMWQGELTTPSSGEPLRFMETLKAWGSGVYCLALITENSPFFTRFERPSTNFATASSP